MRFTNGRAALTGGVVGNGGTPGDTGAHAFLSTESGGMIDLGTLGGTSSLAQAVNARGQVVGSSLTTGDTAQHAALWRLRPEYGQKGHEELPQ
jgi:probable HAF family extracellular repeat protein